MKNGTPDATLERTFKKQRNYTNSLIKKAVREKAGRNITNESSFMAFKNQPDVPPINPLGHIAQNNHSGQLETIILPWQ